MKIEGKNRGEEGTTPMTTAYPEAGKSKCEKKRRKKMRVLLLVLFVFFPWGIPPLQSDWSLSCDHGLDRAS